MKKILFVATFLLLPGMLLLASSVSVLPKPVSLTLKQGKFNLKGNLHLIYPKEDSVLKKAADFMARELHEKTGQEIILGTKLTKKACLVLSRWATKQTEAYHLQVLPYGIRLAVSDYQGAIYGMQTLLQLMPVSVYAKREVGAKSVHLSVPCVSVVDYPRFHYRGMHLDVSRHFFNAQEVKQYIDYLSMHKMNVFHWHLCDDQGWRMESKKYPLLTQISAWRVDRLKDDWRARQPIQEGESPTYGGFYTQDQIKEIVAYAAERGIEIIPEIELPGHSSEVFAAYPQLSCTGKRQDVTPGGYYKDLQTCFCAGNEDVFKFLEDILDETMALFPSKYIHIGADEVNKSYWKKCPKCQQRLQDEHLQNVEELQSYFVKRMEKFINSKGKNLIGWDEIIEGGLAPNATVMSWRGISGGIEGAKSGHDVIMTPENFIYYDYYQNLPDHEPVAIGGLNTLKSIYDFDPVPKELNKKEAKHILGAQANLWSEWILTFSHVQYMSLPRMSALSEVVWSPLKSRNYVDFSRRLEKQYARFSAMGVNFHPRTSMVDIKAVKVGKSFRVSMTPETYGAKVRYTLDGTEPGPKSRIYTQPLMIKNITQVNAKAFSKEWQDAPTFKRVFGRHLAYGKKVSMISPATGRHTALPEQLVDGMTAPYRYADKGYQCVYGKDFEAVVDLGKLMPVRQVCGSFLYYSPNRVHIPKMMYLYVSENGTDFAKADSVASGFDPYTCKSAKRMLEIKKDVTARYIKIVGKNEQIPAGLVGEGKMPAIFCDELFVR